ncbi:MAG TPA: ATP-binding cassette domain-containing protein, partial [Chromatiaceae bacterium]|nr:ATP-binding cassette domain-containing protein [Chromatiaceae bacterium]
MLQGKDVASYYGDVKVLWNISFSIEKGEIVALLGSNGAGKTSLLNTISGILPAKEGSIIFQGKDITKMKPNKIVELGLVQVPEGRKLFPFMTVLENLEIGAYTKRAREKKNEVLSWVYELFPVLRERSHQTAMTLSGGE